MAETKDGSRERRTRAAEIVDAGTDALDAVSRWTPERAMVVMCVLLLGSLCAGFAAQLWIAQKGAERDRQETKEAFSALMREANAREELRSVHCANEAEKVRRESAETVKAILAFQTSENAKFRAEVVAALKGKP